MKITNNTDPAFWYLMALWSLVGFLCTEIVQADDISFFESQIELVTSSGADPFPLEVVLPPAFLSSTSDISSVQLTWQHASGADFFTLQYKAAQTNVWHEISQLSSNTTQYSVSQLNGGTPYEFRIRAEVGEFSSDWSPILTVPTLIPTPVFEPRPPIQNGIRILWHDVDHESSYVLQRKDGLEGSWFQLAELPQDTSGYLDTANLIPGQIYYYRIQALNEFSYSPFSLELSGYVLNPPPPSAPLTARSISGTEVALFWPDVPNELVYRLERLDPNTSNWIALGPTAQDSVTFRDTQVTAGLIYYYRIRGENADGVAYWTYTSQVVPGLYGEEIIADDFNPVADSQLWQSIQSGVATNGGAGFLTNNALYFSGDEERMATTIPLEVAGGCEVGFWFRAGNQSVDGDLWDNSEPGDRVELELSLDSGTTWRRLAFMDMRYPNYSDWVYVTAYLPVTPEATHAVFRWRQLAHSGIHTDTWALDEVTIQSAASLLTPPLAPSFLNSSVHSSTAIALAWGASEGAESYTVERQPSGGEWSSLVEQAAALTSYTDTNCLPSASYSYRVRASNSGGLSPFSSITTAQTWSAREEWSRVNFGTNGIGSASMEAELEDGSRWITRYAFGLDAGEPIRKVIPGESTSGYPAIWYDPASRKLCVEFVRFKPEAEPNVEYLVEFSSDLLSWSTHVAASASQSVNASRERVRHEDPLASGGPEFRFCRIRIRVSE